MKTAEAPDYQLELPVSRWDEGAELRTESGGRLKKWGSVKEAGKILFGWERRQIYLLCEAGEIEAVRRPGGRTKWRVNLLSAWEYKVGILKGEK